MKIVQISVALPETVTIDGNSTTTGIFKKPVAGAVFADFGNLQGDGQADLTVHGGRDKAIYIYSQDYYPLWARDMGRLQLDDAQFGENLTVSGCRDEDIVVGTRLQIGAAEVTVMQPRIPCFKLGIRVGDADFPNRFWMAGRLGFYVRVDQTGLLHRGDPVEPIETPAHGITLHGLWLAVLEKQQDAALRAIECLPHLDAGWQKRLRLAVRT